MPDAPALTLARGLKLPVDAVTAATAVTGQRGTGKTSTAVVMVEEAHAAGAHFCVWDPTGAWYGLRANAKGTGAGLPVVVVGGHHGDLPLEERAGKMLAELIVHDGYNVVIDCELLTKGAQARLGADFFEHLYHINRDALLVVIDEAHRPAPQQLRDVNPYATRCLGAVIDCVSLGRRKGLGVCVVTQRTSRLHKDVLEGCEIMLVHRLVGTNDRKAIAGWLADAAEDKATADQVLARIPKLTRGEVIAYAPALGIHGQFTIRQKRTYDSSATPEIGARALAAPTVPTSIDLEKLRERMAETIEHQQAQDPKLLHERIAELERRLAEKPPFVPDEAAHAQVDSLEEDLRLAGQRVEGLEFERARLRDDLIDLRGLVRPLLDAAHPIDSAVTRLCGTYAGEPIMAASGGVPVEGAAVSLSDSAPTVASGELAPMAPDGHATHLRHGGDIRQAASSNGDAPALKAGAKRMLVVLRRYSRPLDRGQLSTLAVVSKGGTMSDYLSALRVAGMIEEPGGMIQLTDDGDEFARRELGARPNTPYEPAEVVALHTGKLKAGARRMLDVLMRAPADGFTRKELGGLAGVSAGGTLSDYLSALRTRGLAEERAKRVYAGSVIYLGVPR